MLKINPKFFKKQRKVLRVLMDFNNGISEVLFGGSAGGGKSRIGVSWLIIMCLTFAGTRYLMGRSKWSALKITTLLTFFEVCKDWGLKQGEHWNINYQDKVITFVNGSSIIMKDLFLYPSDPEFDSLGSLEITGAFIDEVPQISEKAKNIVASRIRYKLGDFCGHCGSDNRFNEVLSRDENGQAEKWNCKECNSETEGITPKTLMTCNPSRNWVYTKYYKPHKDGKLEDYKEFIKSFVTDNKYISKHYIKNLDRLDPLSRARLRDGIWEYADKLSMFDYDTLVQALATKRKTVSDRNFVGVDVARLGKDNTVVFVISSTLEVLHIEEWGQAKTGETIKKIQEIKDKFDVSIYDIAIDSDGVGGGVADHFDGAEDIVNGSKALNGENYANLKTQLYYKLAEKINGGEIAFNKITDEQAEKLQQELQVLKRTKEDKDAKVSMTTKAEIKASIGRSPDYSDAFAYCMLFFLEELDDSYISF